MLSNRFYFLCYLVVVCSLNLIAQPTPPVNKKWVKVAALSDEFNGTGLDQQKWVINTPDWIGRAPGIFKSESVRVNDGSLNITNSLLVSPEIINGKRYTHAGGLVKSLKNGSFGYYEARMKASETFMSSTFWLVNEKKQGQGCDRRTTELDVIESIGVKTGAEEWINSFTENMIAKAHSRNVECASIPEGYESDRVPLGSKCFEQYFTYGVWWKSAKELLFYLNGKFVFQITTPSDFNLPLYLRFVTETYAWNPVPQDGGMNGSKESRTTRYDWVRTYELVTDERVSFIDLPDTFSSQKSYAFDIAYNASVSREIVVEFWSSNSWLGQQKVVVNAGEGRATVAVNLSNIPPARSGYTAKVQLRPIGATWRAAVAKVQKENLTVTAPFEQRINNGIYHITAAINEQRLLSRAQENYFTRMHNSGIWKDQQWMFTHLGDNRYTIQNVGSKRYLEIVTTNCTNGTAVTTQVNATHQEPKLPQQWSVIGSPENGYSIVSSYCPNYALDISRGQLNSAVLLFSYSDLNKNQKWNITPVLGAKNLEVSGPSPIVLFPNPVVNYLTIAGVKKGDFLQLYDLLGNLHHTTVVDNSAMKISVKALSKGSYFAVLNGGQTTIQFTVN